MRRIFLLVIALNCFNAWSAEKGTSDDIINFADANVKAVCVQYWDTNGDGELSMSEAAAVTTLNRRFYYGEREIITSFDELRFFTNLKVINSGEFENCQNLVSIVLPESISEILAKAFYGCSSLETIQFKEGITKISDQAFYGCKNLKSLSFPKSLNSLGDEAFRGCTGIESVIVPHTLTMSESGSLRAIFPFKGCTGIKNIEIHSPVFGSWFNGLENINKIYVGCEVEKYSAFLAGGVEIIEVDSENKVFDSRNNCNAIIKTATNELVGGCKSTVIPKSVTSISSNAFSNCTNLVAIEIPAGVTSIGSSAFSGCTGLQNVISHIKAPFVTNGFASNTLASATLTIPFGCTNLYKETAGWEFQTIKEMEGTKEDTTYIQFADSLTKKACIKNWDISGDGEISLYEAGLVTSVDFEGSNTITSFDEFKYFTNVAEIGKEAFSGCSALTSITLPNSITSIGERAFQGCKSLKAINIPDGVTAIGHRAFLYCSSLESITIPNTVITIEEYLFAGCTALESVSLSESVTSIGEYAFADCSNLTAISLPEGLETIETYAFDNTGLYELMLPSKLTSIGSYALSGRIIHCQLTEPINVSTLMRDASNVVLYVPQGSEQAFKNATGWKDFIIMNENVGNTDWTEGQITVNVETPGYLRMTLLELDEEEILRLKICGSLNSTDIAYLAEGKGQVSQLESLDLSDVTLVYDGGCYRSYENSGISDTGFESNTYYFYLTEKKEEKHNSMPGIRPAYFYYYYGPDLAGAFWGLPYKHVVMPRGITKAAHSVFRECANLQSVEFPGGLKTVESQAFMDSKMLLSVNLEEVDTIGSFAFNDCKVLTTVNLKKVKFLGDKAFWGCSQLTGYNGVLSFPLVDSIPSQAFYGCSSLGNIQFSENLHFLGESAFSYCKRLSSVNLPVSLQCLSEGTFASCSMLKEVNYSENLMKVHYTAFDNTPWKEDLPIEGGVRYMGHIALCVDNVNDFTSFRDGTTAVSDYFASNNTKITSLSFPASLRRIGDYAFKSNNLESLTLPIGLEQIGEGAFSYSKQLTKVTLNESLKEVGKTAFVKCNQLISVNYNAVALEGKDIFEDCTSLEKVTIGAQVRVLPEGIFNGCSNLTIVKFAERTEEVPFVVGASVFSDCSNLLKVDLPSTTTEIGKEAFQNCTSMGAFVVPQNMTVLNERVFAGCTALNSLQLHDNLEIIGDGAFWDCHQIPTFELAEGIDSIGTEAFSGCYLLKELVIPSTVTHMGDAILEGCYQLTNIVSRISNPQNLASIIPMSKTVLQNVFGYSYNWEAYKDIHYDNVTLTVPAGSRVRYRQATGWNKFANIVQDGIDITENNKLLVDGNVVNNGATTTLAVSLMNDIEDFTAYQFDLIVPLGFTITTDVDENYNIMMGDRYDTSHSLIVEKLPDHQYAEVNKYRFICMSTQNAPIKGSDGNLLEIILHAHEDYKADDYEAELANIIFTRTNGTEEELLQIKFNITVTEAPNIVYGDTNGDGTVNVSDIVGVVNYIMNRSSDNFYKDAADVNRNGEINVSDIVEIVNIIMQDGHRNLQ